MCWKSRCFNDRKDEFAKYLCTNQLKFKRILNEDGCKCEKNGNFVAKILYYKYKIRILMGGGFKPLKRLDARQPNLFLALRCFTPLITGYHIMNNVIVKLAQPSQVMAANSDIK